MKKLKQLNFETHAHIKNIIGQDMINDDNIAVKELVKNSIDADATDVIVRFNGTHTKSAEAEIIIQDNGAGMSLKDIEQKWLNMAYSSKRNDAERSYAGNKGIGRFSADRLGCILHMYTKQKFANEVIKIEIDWGTFENKSDWQEHIRNIKFESYILSVDEFLEEVGIKDFKQGTYLKIKNARYIWSYDKLFGLKRDLEKFMIPRQVEGGEKFKLFLEVSGYEQEKGKNKLSGQIANQVFDKLPFKTSYVYSSIDSKGDKIRTELHHRGELLIELVEKNHYKYLKNANIILFYLNPYHKAFFNRETGMRSVEYGSVFLYLNGFRVPPYGEHENDWLGVDRRHGQGHSRHLGLRDILGRIELKDNDGKTYEVTSDREGIKRNDSFIQLRDISDGYFGHVLKKLEKFVVDGLSWDSSEELSTDIEKRVASYKEDLDNFETHYAHSEVDKETTLIQMLDSIILRDTKKENILSIKFGQRALEILENQREEDVQKLQDKLDKFEAKIESGGKNFRPADLIKTVIEAHKEITNLKQKVNSLEKVSKDTFEKLDVEQKRRLFAEAHMSSDSQKLKEVIHLSGHWGKRIEDSLSKILSHLRQNPDFSKEDLITEIESAQMLSAKITKLSRLITKANFALMSDRTRLDIFSYVEQYIDEIRDLGPYATKIKIKFSNTKNVKLSLNMSALEVSMLIDNIIINAEKHDAKNLDIQVQESEKSFKLLFKDDGIGLTKKYSPESLFEAGITTTNGSGIGLHQVKKIAKNLDASPSIFNNLQGDGAQVCLEWDK